jgi:hypothetical protein
MVPNTSSMEFGLVEEILNVIGQSMFASNTTDGRVVMTKTLGNLHQ